MAFSNAGYSVSDVVTEGDKTTFTAENDNGSFQVEGQNFENETEASQTYETSASQLEDDGYAGSRILRCRSEADPRTAQRLQSPYTA